MMRESNIRVFSELRAHVAVAVDTGVHGALARKPQVVA